MVREFWPARKRPPKGARSLRGRSVLIKGLSVKTHRKFQAWCYERGKSMQETAVRIFQDYRRKFERLGDRWDVKHLRERGAPTGRNQNEGLYVILPQDLKAWLKAHCAKEGWFLQALMRALVEDFVRLAKWRAHYNEEKCDGE